MNLKIACTLEGRDLAVVKSLLNIQKIYNEVEFHFIEETRASHVIIFKEYLDDGAVYYGLNKSTGIKTPILPNLNPRTMRDFFCKTSVEVINNTANINQTEKSHSFEKVLMDYKKSNATTRLKIKFHHGTLIISNHNNIVWSSFNDIELLFSALKSKEWDGIELVHDNESDNKADVLKLSFEQFCWNYGLSIDDELINLGLPFNELKYKLISWPNYGEVVFDQEFIYLSSLVWKRSETFNSLLESSQIDQSIVIQFLNATLLTGHVVMFENDLEDNKINSNVKKTKPFLSRLKKVFGFSQSTSE